MKRWQKVLLIIGLIFSCLACIVNIALSAVFPNCSTNIFTAISGWVSGISTIILGIIAVIQNRNYKKENDRILDEQQKNNSRLMQEQNDSYWQKIQYDMYDMYRREISDFEKEFLKFSTTEFMATVLCDGEKMNALSKMMIFDKQLRNNATRSLAFLRDCPFYCEDKTKLFDLFFKFLDEFKKLYGIIYNAVLNENCLNDLVDNLAQKNIEIEGKILMCYLGIKIEIQIFIQDIFDKSIVSAKEMIQSNSEQNKEWKNKLKEKAKGGNYGQA